VIEARPSANEVQDQEDRSYQQTSVESSMRRRAKIKKIKETSDELAPSAIAHAEEVARARAAHAFVDRAALAIASCGVGFIPLAPGTWGAGLGVAILFATQRASAYVHAWAVKKTALPVESFRALALLAALALLVPLGVWAATRTERVLGRKDPGPVIIDEIAGQLVTFLLVPVMIGWPLALAGFLLFRVFDTWKPRPIRRLESLEAGLGIMMDDIVAGVYAGAALWLFVLARAWFGG